MKLERGRIQDLANQSQISVGRKLDWANSKLYTVATISNPSDSKVIVLVIFFHKVGQPSRSRSLCQKSWYSIEGLATRNAHVK